MYTSYGSLYSDKAILKAIDYKNSVVRTFAIESANSYFRKEQRASKNCGNKDPMNVLQYLKK